MDLGHNRKIDLSDVIPFILAVLGSMARFHDKISLAWQSHCGHSSGTIQFSIFGEFQGV
jgi:hypothetical protein